MKKREKINKFSLFPWKKVLTKKKQSVKIKAKNGKKYQIAQKLRYKKIKIYYNQSEVVQWRIS